MAQALRALSRKERTAAEMLAWLEKRADTAAEAADALAELIAAGALDDERFARCYAEDKRELAGWGDARIAGVLVERGVTSQLIEGALAADEEGELARAVTVLEERGDAPADDAARGRCFAALARRGYSAELAYDAVRRYERAVGQQVEADERAA